MSTTAQRVARRFRAATLDLKTLDISSANLEDVLNDLIAGIDDIEEVEKKLGLDLRNMTTLMRQSPHNDDAHHNGENVLVHIGWVMDDVAKVSEGMEAEKQVLFKLVALCHDLGKPYTYKFNAEKNRHTFYDHAARSVAIAEALLAKHKEQLGTLYQHVLDFTRLHDVFYALVHDRSQGAAGSTKYLKNIMQEQVYQQGLLRDLLTFTKADSFRARTHLEKIKDFETVIEDTKRAEQELVEAEQEKSRLRAQAQERVPLVRRYLEDQGLTDVAALLPDYQAAKRLLGQMKRYDILREVEGILRRPEVTSQPV